MPTTTKWALRYPAVGDSPQGHTAIQNFAEDVATLGLPLSGTLAARPTAAAAKSGQTYWATNTAQYFYSDGTTWREITPMGVSYGLGAWRRHPGYSVGMGGIAAGLTGALWGLDASTYTMAPNTGFGINVFNPLMYLDNAEYGLPGRTTKLRLQVSMMTETSPALTLTFGLHRVSISGVDLGYSPDVSPVGSVIMSSIPSNSLIDTASTEFSYPAADWYGLYVDIPVGSTSAGAAQFECSLQMRHL